jgi:hypothetical protein
MDTHQCLEASNCSRLHPSRRNGKSSGRSSKFEKNPAFKCIRLNDVAIPSGRHLVFDKKKNFFPKHIYGKIAATVWATWLLCPDVILDKASRAKEV